MKRIFDRYPDAKQKFLMVAEGGVFMEPTAISTVLGSCVTVTFHCPSQRIGAAFHALLPRFDEYEYKHPTGLFYRYVDSAIKRTCDKLFARGVKKQDIECKIFGGSSAMFQHEISVGPRNVQVAYETLASLSLRITASNVGGIKGRKIVFISHTGEVYVRQLTS